MDKPQPVEFEIKFITGGIVYQYGIQIDLGTFLDSNYNRKILSETLLVNEKMIFKRDSSLKIGDINVISDMLIAALIKTQVKIWHRIT